MLDRAFTAGAALTVGAVAAFGVFVVTIAHSWAAAHAPASTTTNAGTSEDQSGSGFNSGPFNGGQNNGGQDDGGGFVAGPNNQAPAGGSNGS
jgi:hypothetical protein